MDEAEYNSYQLCPLIFYGFNLHYLDTTFQTVKLNIFISDKNLYIIIFKQLNHAFRVS